jgi:hypothetical protein
MAHGKVLYPDARGGKGKPKSQGGSSTGKRAKFKGGAETPMTKNEGTPRDKGVNR